ncbi:MAG: hypothetical protein RIS86_1634 [Planctomycetota bacterium]|jgi:DNA-binding transcriptional ArsR family regulator
MPRPALHPIRDPKTWSLLVASARIEIVEAMRMLAPCSIAEIAAVLDRPADTLYRHVDKLVAAGLVVQTGVRRSGRRFEQVFDLVADDFTFGFKDGSGRAANKAFEECANSFLKSTGRAVRDSAAAGRLVASDSERNVFINYELGWLGPEDFASLRALLQRAKALMDDGKRRRDGQLFLALSIVTPVTRKRGARRPADEARAPRTTRRAAAASSKETDRSTGRATRKPAEGASAKAAPVAGGSRATRASAAGRAGRAASPRKKR